ncbi:MAG: C-GCAxxG-C-C family (seleno)protein [Clostridia bacterium]|nr:C-GCAxxG-C-C family (seleno)protein [Clostridia bacterium]
MNMDRRLFLKNSAKLAAAAAAVGSAVMAVPAIAETAEETKAPVYPFPYVEVDPDEVMQAAYDGYFENGCCYGAAKALLGVMREKVGFPYNMIPAEMFANGKEGYTCGTLCGALGGAVGFIGLVCEPEASREIVKKLFAWYCSTELPIYQPEGEAPCKTVAPSVNCVDSVSTFMTAANVERKDPIRKRRCGGLTADVARKTIELLNIHFGYAEEPVEVPVEETLAANEYIGVAQGFGGETKVKVTMDGDKIAKIEVLSHNDTPGVCDPAYKTIPDAIIAAQSTKVDVASGATVSSNGIMAAVEDALSKVGK